MQSSLPPGISIAKADDLEEWHMDLQVLDSNPIYADQTYRLKFSFSKSYPIGKRRLWLPSGYRSSHPALPTLGPYVRHF